MERAKPLSGVFDEDSIRALRGILIPLVLMIAGGFILLSAWIDPSFMEGVAKGRENEVFHALAFCAICFFAGYAGTETSVRVARKAGYALALAGLAGFAMTAAFVFFVILGPTVSGVALAMAGIAGIVRPFAVAALSWRG